MASLRELFDEKSEPATQPADNRRIVIETFVLIVTLLTALANFFGQATGWFQWIAAALAIVVIVWVASQLISWLRRLWAIRRERAALAGTVRELRGEFKNLVARFNPYADNNRSDTIPRFLIWLCMEEKVEIPIADTSLFHIWRLHEVLRERIPLVANSPAEFRSLAQQFGETLDLYHRLYVLRPYQKLRSTDVSGFSPYSRTRVREELAVQRED